MERDTFYGDFMTKLVSQDIVCVCMWGGGGHQWRKHGKSN